MTPLRILIVDDEAPARMRLRDLLSDIAPTLPTQIVGEAADGGEGLALCIAEKPDVVLSDVRMPRMDGIELAQHLGRLDTPPGLIFITAFDQYAIKAFDLAAVDYLLKPVRAARLGDALRKAQHAALRLEQLRALAPKGRQILHSVERGRSLLIPVADVLYLRAELKYVTARTRDREYLIEESLSQLEQEFGDRFVRAHRNCLVAREALLGYERSLEAEEGGDPQWLLILHGVDERIHVSRRQWPQLKALFQK